MSARWLFCAVAACIAVLLIGPATVKSSPSLPIDLEQGAASRDSLQYQTTAGDVLIVDLPGEVTDDDLVRYEPLRVPALSWLVSDSFFWRTRSGDAGSHRLLFRATYQNAPPDTLAVSVEVVP